MRVRLATEADLDAVVRLVDGQQDQPNRHIAYLGSDPESIRADIVAVEDWSSRTVVSTSARGSIDGCILAELDADMGGAGGGARLWMPTTGLGPQTPCMPPRWRREGPRSRSPPLTTATS